MRIEDLGRYKDGVEVIYNVFAGIGLAVIGAYLAYAKDLYDENKFCFTAKTTLLTEAADKKFSQESVLSRVDLIRSMCPERIDEFHTILKQISGEARAVCTGAKCALDPAAARGDADSANQPLGGAGILKGWLAVGTVNADTNREANFTLAATAQKGAPSHLPKDLTLAAGAILKARWQVNVRRAPADWDNDPLGIIDIGQCVRVGDTRLLPAGERKQLWAEVAKIECDAALVR